jgi:hypothetical protein
MQELMRPLAGTQFWQFTNNPGRDVPSPVRVHAAHAQFRPGMPIGAGSAARRIAIDRNTETGMRRKGTEEGSKQGVLHISVEAKSLLTRARRGAT